MKKYLFFAVAMFLLSVVSLMSEDVPTDPPPCPNTGCDPDEWRMVDWSFVGLTQCPQCTVHVFVKYNESCNQIFLQQYYLISEECDVCFSNGDMSWYDVHRGIINEILLHGPLSPSHPGEEIITRVTEFACWQPIEGGPSGMHFAPCETAACCKRTYKVVMEADHSIFYTFLNGEHEGDACTEPCFSICSLEDWYPSLILSSEDDSFDNNAIIYPNPSTGIFQIKFSNEKNGSMIFEIYDINGNKIKYFNFIKNNYSENINLDISNLSAGVYYYKIFFKKENLSSGKIILNK